MNKKSIPAQKNWILIPVYNRLEVTRSCLNNLRKIGVFSNFTVCVIDDGCTDGTSEMLVDEFPKVHVIQGDGNLYWGGGISTGMAAARAANAEVHVWLNDDCLPDEGSIEVLVNRVRETKGMCGGICRDPKNESLITYGGCQIGAAALVQPPAGHFEPSDVMNGNLVAIHTDAVERIGLLDSKRFPHYGGDTAYCINARFQNIATEIAGSATAVNPRGNSLEAFGLTKPANAIFNEPFRLASPLYLPTYWQVLRLSYGWKAYLRCPAYFIRLVKLWRQACKKATNNSHGRGQ
jgi:GT2 family glycosyltransferase